MLLSDRFRCFLKIKEENPPLFPQTIVMNVGIFCLFSLTTQRTSNRTKYAVICRQYNALNYREWIGHNIYQEATMLLKILRAILAIIVISLGVYSLISRNYTVMPHTMFFMGVMLLVMGIDEFMEARKLLGIFSMLVSVFVFYVSVQSFI